ncbi:glycosyltransferase family 4 protein [Deinococcus yavapaiensis]|uniref:Glycosyltransferase involved in cell wall biosynthesis n=1 Tax=Deinococcus yavapaiensis KR-236 TaxID=694435 RepID=A0A318S9V7_9DEIO|nr:glycosyltransferase family 1 protein [Deinococcus yavapaiensis]PYE55659.1 glycosyltransferase involved in cell wall biosynthesis [Deinococcus yavapaiensis KR-236]
MKVGMFTYGMADRLTGIGRYTVELTRALRRVEPTLEVVLLNPYPASPLPWYREFETYDVPHLAKAPLAATLGNLELRLAADRLKLDVLHDPCGIAPFVAPRGRHARVVTVHDAIPVIDPSVQPPFTRAVFKTLIPAARWTADAIITISQSAAHDLEHHLRLPREKLHVTLNGVAPPVARSEQDVRAVLDALDLDEPYFLYVGALDPRKNLQRVLEAFAAVEREQPSARLVIVGGARWQATPIVERAKGMRNVRLTGFVSDADLAALYQGATALVFPSLYEGFGLPILEAMTYGTPVITSSVSSMPEVAGDAALLVNPLDVEALVNAMRSLLTQTALRAELSRRGCERATLFTWEQTARQTLEVYASVLNRRH